MAHKVDPDVMNALWDRVKNAITEPVRLFVRVGIKADKGMSKKDTEEVAWRKLVEAAFKEGVALGYDMGMVVAGVPDPNPKGGA